MIGYQTTMGFKRRWEGMNPNVFRVYGAREAVETKEGQRIQSLFLEPVK